MPAKRGARSRVRVGRAVRRHRFALRSLASFEQLAQINVQYTFKVLNALSEYNFEI